MLWDAWGAESNWARCLGAGLAVAGALEAQWREGASQATWRQWRGGEFYPGFELRGFELVLTDPEWLGRSPWEWREILAYRNGQYSWQGREADFLRSSG